MNRSSDLHSILDSLDFACHVFDQMPARI
jgi:hypothetical protein